MPTLRDFVEALKRHGAGKIAIVSFGLVCLVVVNCFKSTNNIDVVSNIVFGVLIVAAMLIPNRT